jgi:hypothetical protein
MKKLIGMAVMLLFIIGCAIHEPTPPRPANILSCENPQAEKKYVCFSDKECTEYLKGYSAVFQMRTSPKDEFYGLGQGEEHPVIHMYLHYAHKNMTIIGRIEGELRDYPRGGKRWYMMMWTIVCNGDGEILDETYSEGFRKAKVKEYEEEIEP